MAGTEFSQGELEARCRDLALSLESIGEIPDEDLAAALPTSPEATWWDWVRAFARLQVLHDRYTRPATPANTTPDVDLDDARVIDAIRGAPKVVRLLPRGPGKPDPAVLEETPPAREVFVYPKSFLALVECHNRGQRLGWLAARIQELQTLEAPTAEQLELMERATAEMTYQQRILAWIVTTPGPGLPYPEFRTEELVPPAEFDEWDGWDHLAVLHAFQEANSLKQPALDRLLQGIPREDGGGWLNAWSVFFGSLAQETDDKDSHRLMRDRPLVGLLGQVRLAAGARDASMAAARDRAAAGRD